MTVDDLKAIVDDMVKSGYGDFEVMNGGSPIEHADICQDVGEVEIW